MLVTTVGVMVLGGIYMVIAKPYESAAMRRPAGDCRDRACTARRLRIGTGGGVVAPVDG